MSITPDNAATNRPGFFRRNWIFVSGTLLFVIVNLIYILNSEQGDALVAINGMRNDGADIFFRIGTKFAEPEAYLGVLVIVTAFSYRRGIFAIIAGTAAGVAAGLLKIIFSQPRPMRWFFDNANEIWHSLNHFEETYRNWGEESSFPSGHATSAFALYGFLAFNARRGRKRVQIICLGLALMVALSRMYLLYHFLRDVTAGAFLGLLVGTLIYLLQERFYPNADWVNRGWLDVFQKDPEVSIHVPPPETGDRRQET